MATHQQLKSLTQKQLDLYYDLNDLFEGVASDLGIDDSASSEFVEYARDWMCWEKWDKKHSLDDVNAAFKIVTGKKWRLHVKTSKVWEVVRTRPDGTESRNSFGRGAEEEGDAWELYSRLTAFAGTVTISKNGKIVDEQTKTYSL